MKPVRYCYSLCLVQHKPVLSLRRKRTQTLANKAIDVLVVDLIPANPIELFGNRGAQANTNRSGAWQSIIELSRMFDYQTIKINHSK